MSGSRLFIPLIICLLLLPIQVFQISIVSAIGGYTPTPPAIDGTIDAAEWITAGQEHIDLGGGYTGTLYIMNDLLNIYVAVEINDPAPGNDFLGFAFDHNNDGVMDDGAEYYQIAHAYQDVGPSGVDAEQNGGAASTSGGGKNYFEFIKPLHSGAPEDISVIFGHSMLKIQIVYSNPAPFFLGTSEWILVDLISPSKIEIQNVRHPNQVKVGQNVFVTVEAKYELMLPDSPLEIRVVEGGVLIGGPYTEAVSENGTITHTFELTAPAAPATWEFWISAVHHLAPALVDAKMVSIEVKDDLGITPEVEGICIWDGPPPPDYYLVSDTIEIPIEVKYAVTYDAWIHVGIYDETGALISTAEFDETVSGVGANDYIFEVNTPAVDTVWNLKASLYYGHVAGVDSVHNECDEWPFTLIITSGVPGGEGVKIMDVNSPTEVNSSAEVSIDALVEYQLPTANTKYRVNILDAYSGSVLRTSEEKSWPAPAWGFTTFNFDHIYAPFVPVDTTFKLIAAAEYQKPGEDWKILDPEGMREFEILVRGVAVPAGELPLGPDIPPLPLPPGVLPPPPADFDFTLTVNPSSREAVPGQTISYGVTVSASVNTTQFVLLGVSGYPLGATVNLGTLGGTPTYTSNLTLTLGDSVQPGPYTLTVNASGGDKTHSQTVSLNVKAAPDFSVALSQPEVRIIHGQSGYLDMTVQSLNGFSSPVNLAVKGSPSGVTVNFNPASSAPSFTSKIEVKVDGNVAAGTYPLTITAKGSGERVAQAILNVEAPRPEVAAAGQQPFPYGLLVIIMLLVILISLILAMRRRGSPRLRSEKFCTQCGAKVHMDAAHCPKCGAKQS